ncbi:MAG TPA: peptide deformylase [Verrucomicrobiota bacterium]|nr:peptide deformylase [Verrucomicrobiota bacterium]
MKSTSSTFGPEKELEAPALQRQPPTLSLVFYPNPILRAICRPVDNHDSALRDLIQEMFSLMHMHAGIGLAGPQVAVEQRVLVCAIRGQQLCLTNPEIREAGQPGEFVEGCLSLPDVQISVTRPERIQVIGYDERGRKTRFGATGLWARVIQHELDHLNGVLICDRGRPPAQPCGPCSLALPTVLIEERKRQSQASRSKK